MGEGPCKTAFSSCLLKLWGVLPQAQDSPLCSEFTYKFCMGVLATMCRVSSLSMSLPALSGGALWVRHMQQLAAMQSEDDKDIRSLHVGEDSMQAGEKGMGGIVHDHTHPCQLVQSRHRA